MIVIEDEIVVKQEGKSCYKVGVSDSAWDVCRKDTLALHSRDCLLVENT
jgi:hypothetical protein